MRVQATKAFAIPSTDADTACIGGVVVQSGAETFDYAIRFALSVTPDGTLRAQPDPVSLAGVLGAIRHDHLAQR
ncbi:MAG: hypothetical protein CVV05_01085 [Gammaproteobacteria bacterium HGW-Gammaproteobacteria-1]|nr:MAG: hypothetical protein CVV05_01085 [Gammaproteobacteria bacterium HGW-Gammaproteobacteria-1]